MHSFSRIYPKSWLLNYITNIRLSADFFFDCIIGIN